MGSHRAGDTPLRSLYRIYEALVACGYVAISPELASAFNWRLSLGMRRDKRKYHHRHRPLLHCLKTLKSRLFFFLSEE